MADKTIAEHGRGGGRDHNLDAEQEGYKHSLELEAAGFAGRAALCRALGTSRRRAPTLRDSVEPDRRRYLLLRAAGQIRHGYAVDKSV